MRFSPRFIFPLSLTLVSMIASGCLPDRPAREHDETSESADARPLLDPSVATVSTRKEVDVDPLDQIAERLADDSSHDDKQAKAKPCTGKDCSDEPLDLGEDEHELPDLGPDPEAAGDEDDVDAKGSSKHKAAPGPSFDEIRCPSGTKLVGTPPPKGSSMMCVKQSTFGATRHGPLIKWGPNGEKKFEATYADDELDGLATSYFPTGDPAEEREYRKGVLNGRWSKWNKNGEKTAEGSFVAGKKDGEFRYWSRRGELTAQGYFRNNVRNGQWSFFDRQGGLKERLMYRDGKKNGKGEKFAASGRVISVGDYKDNKPEGVWMFYDKNGRLEARGAFERGRKSGPWTYYDQSGQIKKAVQYQNGQESRVARGGAPVQHRRSGEDGFVDM